MSQSRPTGELNDIIAGVLRYGVVLSAAVMVVGLILLFTLPSAGRPANLQSMFDSGFGRPTLSPSILLAGVMAANPVSVLELGALILFATPLARVTASVLLFWREGDRLYMAITLLVLAMLLVAVFVIGPLQA